MGRYGVHATSEVHIVGKVQPLTILELLCNVQQQKETASETVLLLILLMLFQQLQLLSVVCCIDHLWSDRPLIETSRNGAQATTNAPKMLNHIQNFLVDRPFLLTKYIEDLSNGPHVGLFKELDSFLESGVNFGNSSLPQIVSTKGVTFPLGWLVNHWQGSVHLQIQVIGLVKLSNELLNEALIECDISVVLEFLVLPPCYDGWF